MKLALLLKVLLAYRFHNQLQSLLYRSLKNHSKYLIFVRVDWRKPAPGWYKLNTDGSLKGNPGRVAIGGLVRDSSGMVQFAFHKDIGQHTNSMAELTAMLHGLELCKARGQHHIWVETDSQVAVQLIQSKQQGNWVLQHTIIKIQKLLTELEVQISHILREGNQPADCLANLDMGKGKLVVFEPSQLPRTIQSLVYWESLNYPDFRFY